MRVLAAGILCMVIASPALGYEGRVTSTSGEGVSGCYVGILNGSFAPIAGMATDSSGSFRIDASAEAAYLIARPPTTADGSGMNVYRHQPRLYALKAADRDKPLELRLPPAVNYIIEAYDRDGKLLRWKDFLALGTIGNQFTYVVDRDDIAFPSTVYPLHGSLTGEQDGARESSVPGILVTPGDEIAFYFMFWPTDGYGKLQLRADNGLRGYALGEAGASQRLVLNVELARTAVAKLQERAALFPAAQQEAITSLKHELDAAVSLASAPEQAKAADPVLAKALRMRDELEFARAKEAIPSVRRGRLQARLVGSTGTDWSQYTVSVDQQRHDFLFAAFEGSPYNARAYEAARKGGFELTTVLLGWNWTQDPKLQKGHIDQLFGISALRDLGFMIKAHGVIWMQVYGILPEKALTMPHDQLMTEALEHQQQLLDLFGEDIAIWEAMNEPANVNVVDLPKPKMQELLATAAKNIAGTGHPALVNSPHEFSNGAKYVIYTTDNEPLDKHPETFNGFLRRTQAAGNLDDIDIIGLQFYPGLHFNVEFHNLQGPCYTPSHVLDTIERYAEFDRPVHITELSFPSSYGDDWYCGYWKEPWTEQLQAEYAEVLYTLMFAHPSMQSVGWWDIMDTKPSVITGGLIHDTGQPKPVFDRITGLIKEWSSHESATPGPDGVVELEVFAGEYEVRATGPDGAEAIATCHIPERGAGEVELRFEGEE